MEEKFNLEFKLNQKQIQFCHEYLRNGGIARQAYSKVYGTSPAVSSTNGAGLLRKPDVQKYLTKLQEKIQNQNVIELEEIIENLKKIEQECREKGKYDQAIEANKQMALIMGYNKKSPTTDNSSNSITIQILPPNNNKTNKFIDITHTETKGELPPTTITVSSNQGGTDNDTDINSPPQTITVSSIEGNSATDTNTDTVGDDDDELPFKD